MAVYRCRGRVLLRAGNTACTTQDHIFTSHPTKGALQVCRPIRRVPVTANTVAKNATTAPPRTILVGNLPSSPTISIINGHIVARAPRASSRTTSVCTLLIVHLVVLLLCIFILRITFLIRTANFQTQVQARVDIKQHESVRTWFWTDSTFFLNLPFDVYGVYISTAMQFWTCSEISGFINSR